MLNTTGAFDKKITREKSNCLIHNISLMFLCLLLLVAICVSSNFDHAKY